MVFRSFAQFKKLGLMFQSLAGWTNSAMLGTALPGATSGPSYLCMPDTTGSNMTNNPTGLGPIDSPARNPLLCFLCKDYYSEPVLLACYHTFCTRCLQSQENEHKITCPLCG